MTTKVAAISGGVDSVVLLDMLSKAKVKVIVAHVDHGIRDDSADDARFVRQLAKEYGYPYEEKQLHLGADASEEKAREARYSFLYVLAKKHKAEIITAHHADDLAETVAINLHRGTGWRGLAVLSRSGIERPLLGYSKKELYAYAMEHGLEWVEDKTNHDRRYLRNQFRARLATTMSRANREHLVALRNRQVALVAEIAKEEQDILSYNHALRYLLTQIDQPVAIDILGTYIVTKSRVRPTRPQLMRALMAVKTAKPGTIHHIGGKTSLRFKSRFFSVEVL